MTFDLSSEQQARVAAIGVLATSVIAPAAVGLDENGLMPPAIIEALEGARVWDGDLLGAVIAIEEIAVVSGAAAAWVALGRAGSAGPALAGLRGASSVEAPNERQRLALASVCVGLGRAAVGEAVGVIKDHGERPTGDVSDPPHWTLADAATEVDAARLLVRAAAAVEGAPGAAAALVFAGGAAVRAVDAAVRLVGPDAFRPGSLLERAGRDARAALLIAGTEDAARRVAADILLSR